MFNRILKSAALLFGAVVLAACGSNYANAQAIPLNYKSTAGVPFSIQTAQKITGLPGSINVVDATGFASTSSSATMYTDSSALVYTKIVTDPAFLALFIQVGSTTEWINPAYIRLAYCSASKTNIRYQNMPTEVLNDNCAWLSTYQARAN